MTTAQRAPHHSTPLQTKSDHPPNGQSKQTIEVLHGLRGLACLLVFNVHLNGNFTGNPDFGYGAEGIAVPSQLPLVRVWMLGTSPISVLMVISGYVLSHGVLVQAYARNDLPAASRRLASMVLRRPIRLFLPALGVLLLCGLESYVGLYEASRKNYGVDNEIYFLGEEPPPRFKSLVAQMKHVMGVWFGMVRLGIWADNNPPRGPLYNPPLWTIPLEFQTSMILFLVLLCVSYMKPIYGQTTFLLLMVHSFVSDRWEVLCTTGGAFLAAVDVVGQMKRSHSSTRVSSQPSHQSLGLSFTKGGVIIFFGLLLLSAPVRESAADRFYGQLASLWLCKGYDECSYLRAIGALLTTWGLLHCPCIGSILTNKLLLYFGDTSFSLYLVHGQVFRIILHSIIPSIYAWTGDGTYDGQGTWATVVAWAVGMFVCLPITVLVAKLFQNFVEQPSIRIGQWLERSIYHTDAKINTA